MKITVLGGGAMGALYGGYLSRSADVTIIDVNPALVDAINASGVLCQEPDGTQNIFRLRAAVSSEGMEVQDLIIVFVKAMFSESALNANRGLIGPDTCLLTMQNGSGHEDTLLKFADRAHVLIGTTQHNSAVLAPGSIRHGGSGKTTIGPLEGDPARLEPIADAFNAAGLETVLSGEVQKQIWNKMFTNVSASVLTGILQCPLGHISEDANAWAICVQLIHEAVAVAAGEGISFDADEKIAEVKKVCDNSPKGFTSIYADLRDGRRSEVDTISGSIVRASHRNGVPAPTHELMVRLVHAMETRKKD